MNKRTQVLLAMDASPADRELIRAIPLLLGAVPFSLTGLYIQDEEVLRASDLPVVKEVSLSGTVRQFNRAQLSLEFDRMAQRLRHALDDAVRGFDCMMSFEVVQGHHASELARAAIPMDFVIVTRPQRPGALRPRQGKQLLPLVDQAKNLLIVNEPWSSGRSIVAVYENTGSAPSIELAKRYAEDTGLELVVAVPVGVDMPDTFGLTARQTVSLDWSEEQLARLCAAKDARLLVLASSDTTDWANLLPELIDRVPCSILRLA